MVVAVRIFICLNSAVVLPNSDGKQTMTLFVHNKRHFEVVRRYDVIVLSDFERLQTHDFSGLIVYLLFCLKVKKAKQNPPPQKTPKKLTCCYIYF